jgi:Spy/CpxP family protein refolding chaperone
LVAVGVLVMQAMAATWSAPLAAQSAPPATDPRGQRDDPRRAELARRFQQRVDAMVRQRLQLNDDQAARLREVASRTEGARRALRRDEMEARKAMREELLAGDNANEARVADLLDQMPRLERRRVELLEQEQRELSRFLSPLQRARYFALQDELRRGMQELQRRRMGDGDSSRHGMPPEPDMRMRRRPPGGDR